MESSFHSVATLAIKLVAVDMPVGTIDGRFRQYLSWLDGNDRL